LSQLVPIRTIIDYSRLCGVGNSRIKHRAFFFGGLPT
jgi:hypothetical protein